MKRAAYARENRGHFGLASPAYVHFTSPIRRYPDLMVHRAILASVLNDGAVEALPAGSELEEQCMLLSGRERAAEEAERESVLLHQLEIMSERVGEHFEGQISSVTPFGAFVRLDDPFVEGLLHVRRIEGDYMEFDPERMALVGRRNGRTLQLGQRLEVMVASVDRQERRIDFDLVEPERDGEEVKPNRGKRERKRRW